MISGCTKIIIGTHRLNGIQAIIMHNLKEKKNEWTRINVFIQSYARPKKIINFF
jgi:hypothetical protein